MARQPVRIVDIARRLGVSTATVSTVLNDKAAQGRISAEMQEAVWSAARSMGYQPNMAARRLRSSALVEDSIYLAVIASLETPFSLVGAVMLGVQSYAAECQESLQLTIETFRMGQLCALPGLHNNTRFHGAIITNTGLDDDAFIATTTFSMPVVLFLRQITGANCVTSNSTESGQRAAELMFSRGRRRPAVLAPLEMTQARLDRMDGYKAFWREAGIEATEIWAVSFNERSGYAAMDSFLSSGGRCDALFVVGDSMAVGAMAAIKSAGLRIPEDVAVVGHDDLDFASFTDPPLTTFHLPVFEMARDATSLLLQLLRSGVQPPVRRIYPAELVTRTSA